MTRAVPRVVSRPTLLAAVTATLPALALPALTLGQSATNNPFPTDIATGTLAVRAVPFAQASSPFGSNVRMNDLTSIGDGRSILTDQRGALLSIPAGGGAATTYLNLRTFAGSPGLDGNGDGEKGVGSAAFHPDFLNATAPGFGKFYTVQSAPAGRPVAGHSGAATFSPPGGGRTHDEVLLEWSTPTPSAATFGGTVREVLRVAQPFNNHNGGGLRFNQTAAAGSADFGKLYYSTGDGGSGGDPRNLAESTANAFGKILRIDPLGRDAGKGYAVPTDARSPFAADGDAGTLGEIFAYGLRNPQRFAFDDDGSIFVGDIGQGVVEEVDRIGPGQAGANLGWNAREGSFEFVSGGSVRDTPTPAGLLDPIAEYDHSNGHIAVSGGLVYRGGEIAGLEGQYLFGDLNAGEVYYTPADAPADGGQDGIRKLVLLDEDGNPTTTLNTFVGGRSDVRFGLGGGGELLLLNKRDGTVRQLVAVPEPASLAAVGLIAVGLASRRRAMRRSR